MTNPSSYPINLHKKDKIRFLGDEGWIYATVLEDCTIHFLIKDRSIIKVLQECNGVVTTWYWFSTLTNTTCEIAEAYLPPKLNPKIYNKFLKENMKTRLLNDTV